MKSREIRLSGYSRVLLKSSQEPSTLALREGVQRENDEAVEPTGKETKKMKGELQIPAEETSVGGHQSNGEVEYGIMSVQSQTRTMRLELQARCKSKIRTDHPIVPWQVHHSAFLIDVCRIGSDGRILYERRKGKKFHIPCPNSGNALGT